MLRPLLVLNAIDPLTFGLYCTYSSRANVLPPLTTLGVRSKLLQPEPPCVPYYSVVLERSYSLHSMQLWVGIEIFDAADSRGGISMLQGQEADSLNDSRRRWSSSFACKKSWSRGLSTSEETSTSPR